ncbi:hypothetical protein BH10ACI4_BH10ACI4_12030 [soil metagenome]
MDVRTLFFVEASLLFLFGLTMMVNSIGQRWQRGTFYFAASNFIGGLGLILHSAVPDGPRIVTMVLANLCLYLELALINKAIAEFVQRGRGLWLYLIAVGVVVSALSLEVIFVHPSMELRIVSISFVIVATSACSATLLFRYPSPGVRVPILVMGSLLLVYMTTNASRMVLVWWFPKQSFYHIWLDRTLVAGLSFGYLWMTAARLRLELEHQAGTDALTGTLNRRAIQRETMTLFDGHRHSSQTSSALMLDVDYFKQINDRFGHYAGDLALCAIADCLRQNTRSSDLIARLGGDEFLVVLPNTSPEQAEVVASHLRECISQLHVTSDAVEFPIRASIGAASIDSATVTLESLMKECDRALYVAKARNHRAASPSLAV